MGNFLTNEGQAHCARCVIHEEIIHILNFPLIVIKMGGQSNAVLSCVVAWLTGRAAWWKSCNNVVLKKVISNSTGKKRKFGMLFQTRTSCITHWKFSTVDKFALAIQTKSRTLPGNQVVNATWYKVPSHFQYSNPSCVTFFPAVNMYVSSASNRKRSIEHFPPNEIPQLGSNKWLQLTCYRQQPIRQKVTLCLVFNG